MEAIAQHNEIHLVLKDLIEMKSRRDHKNFTLSQLAKALGMPHSIINKLAHEDPSRRVCNPRIDTLNKIVNFFRNDGFDITIDDFLRGFKDKSVQRVGEQEIATSAVKKLVPLYFIDQDLKNRIGTVEVDLMTYSESLIALVSDEFIGPMFKKGSIFIVDTSIKPENDTLVAAQIPDHDKILIRKLWVEKQKMELRLHDEDRNPLSLLPTMHYKIIGVVIQVHAKT